MCHVAVDRLVILPIDDNILIGDLRITVLGPQLFGGLVIVIITQISPGTSLCRIYVTRFQNLESQRFGGYSRGGINISPQVLDHALRKRHLACPIGYVFQGYILGYHELGQVSHDLG